ncbi:MAG: hypothetical protein GF311_04500 [Candidatus Lokiarchaeota archaeon]|nr:hypothetical protein [Candidatus Lokiarchaeota archaeon]
MNFVILNYWDIVAKAYNTTLSFILLAMVFLMVYIGKTGRKKNPYGGLSTFVCASLLLFVAYYNSVIGLFQYPLTGFMIWWIGILILLFGGFGYLVKKTDRKMTEEDFNTPNGDLSRIKRYIKKMEEQNPYREQIPIKMEIVRKSFHLTGLLFIFGYFGCIILPPIADLANLGIYILITSTEPLYNVLWGEVSNYPYVLGSLEGIIDITLFGLIGAFMFMVISDLIRVLWGPKYSMFNFLTRSVLRNQEHNAVGPHIYLIVGAIFTYLLYVLGVVHILAFTAGLMIACFSDALAALVGRIFGNKKVICIGGQEKTIEGFIAGVASAYLFALVIVGPIYAIIGALIFFIFDYFPMVIADNILNPIFITLGIQLFQIILVFPLGLF